MVNPNGIVFGENAQLDVGGSFIATTANSIQFEDGIEFAAKNAEAKPTLTVSVPIGLGFAGDNGAITVNGNGSQIKSDTRFSPIDIGNSATGLSVTSGKTLALVGSEITFDGGIVTAEGGKIEIGSVNSGSVRFQEIDNDLAFGYENTDTYQDIALTQQALLNASGEGSGAISLTGNNISLSDSSFILIQNQGQVDSSSLNINAFESLTLSGTTSDQEVSSGIRSESLNTGQGAKIDISTRQLQLRDGAQIIDNTYSEVSGSNILIGASDSIEVFGGSISAGTFAEGEAGGVQLSTGRLEIMEGGSITSSTIGSGDGGEVTINADSIDVAGRVSIDRSNIAAVSFNSGNAGSLNINTKQLRIRDQALVNTSARATGNAGSITINASESIEVSGTNKNFPSTIRAGVELTNSEARKIFKLPEVPSGNAGNIIINSPKLDVINEGVVNVSNEGTGDAGTLFINAEKVNLYDTGSILATTASGTGGNINLSTQNLEIGVGSKITATAENDGDGGNININTTNLIAKKTVK
ncbi:MAG: S-layer family protein [Pleurocapsa sp. CRU_1_2]|nr:S-layer family protein [Pleurocapsa sp. CRU_1_2]